MKSLKGWFKTCFILFLLFSTSAVFAQQNEPPTISLSPEKGLWIESADGFMGLKLGLRLQQQVSISVPIANSDETVHSDMLIRRSRALFIGYIFDKKLTYFFQLGMDRGNVTLLNAEYRWKPSPTTKISFGQLFPPVGRQFQTISKNFQMADRSNVTRFFFTDWDLGISVRQTFEINKAFAIKAALSTTHGEGKNVVTADGGWAYSGRLELLPFGLFNAGGDYTESDLYREPTPKLSIGTAYYLNTDAYTKYGNIAWKGLDDDITELYLDMVFKYKGFSLLTEYIQRSVDNARLQVSPTVVLNTAKNSGEGFYIQGGKFISKNIEPTFRISLLNPDNEVQSSLGKFIFQKKYSVGINNFIKNHSVKFQTQCGLVKEDFSNQNSRTYIEVLAQFSISF